MLNLKYFTILKVAVPLMVSSFIQSVVYLTDAAFLSRYDTISFDASGNAGLIYVTVFLAISGMADGSQILIARCIGEDRKNAIGRIFGTSVLVHTLLAILLFSFVQLVMPSLLYSYSKHPDLALAQVDFISYRSFALFFAMITLSVNAFLYAHGKTTIVLIAAIITATSNVLMDYLFIWGIGIFPEMGLKGAALASTLADGLGMIFLLLYLLFSSYNKELKLFSYFSIDLTSVKELVKLGSPMLLQGVIALSTWTIFFTWIEQIGKFELTVSQNIRAIYFLAFVPIWGFSATTKTYISQYIGKKDYASIPVIQKRIQLLMMASLFILFHGAFLYPEFLISFINPDPIFQEKSGEILRYVTISLYIYGFFCVYFQTINGRGDTKITFYIEVICVILYIIAAYLLIKVFKTDIYWIWSVEYVYFITMGILSFIYLKRSSIKNQQLT